MPYTKIPNRIHFGSKALVDCHVGTGADAGKYIWQVPRTGGNTTYIKTTSVPTWTLSSSTAGTFTSLGEYGGELTFTNGGGWLIYYLPSWSKWLMVKNCPYFGYIPRADAVADFDEDGTYTYTYGGDIWWEATSLNSTPWNNAAAGTFQFGLRNYAGTYSELAPYNVTHTFNGYVTPPFTELSSGSYGPQGFYKDRTYVGFPEWRYRYEGNYHYVTKYGELSSQWYNIKRYELSSLGTHSIGGSWNGWVATSILGGAPTAAETGFYATSNQPSILSSFTLKWYHFVPDDPDDPESPGVISAATSWVDKDGNTHSTPNINASWQGLKSASNVNVPPRFITKRVGLGEAAIWR